MFYYIFVDVLYYTVRQGKNNQVVSDNFLTEIRIPKSTEFRAKLKFHNMLFKINIQNFNYLF